jgi:hypothetical protein
MILIIMLLTLIAAILAITHWRASLILAGVLVTLVTIGAMLPPPH